MPKAALHTLGCRLNQAETAIIANSLKQRGFEIVEFGQPADLTVINTCTVTEQADAKCRQAVRRSIRENPQTFVAVVGCYAQMAVNTIRAIEGVDLIVGNEHKFTLADYVSDLEKRDAPLVVHSSKISRSEFVIKETGLHDNHTRANLKIQDGCNFICSFCIIATARGPARSRKFADLIREAEELAGGGFKEVVLTGVNIGTYQSGDNTFLDVLKALERIAGLERIRISSIEPTTIGFALIDYMADAPKICRHLHIPLQSGDDRILESMRRKHSRTDYQKIIEYAYDKLPGVGLGTDIMVGYPGEDEASFRETKKFVADLPLAYFHVFSYSDRKGTTAWKLKPKVSHAEKKQRARVMIEMGERKRHAFYRNFLGKRISVLFEARSNGHWFGFSDNYMKVSVPVEGDLKNQLKPVKLLDIREDQILGAVV